MHGGRLIKTTVTSLAVTIHSTGILLLSRYGIT